MSIILKKYQPKMNPVKQRINFLQLIALILVLQCFACNKSDNTQSRNRNSTLAKPSKIKVVATFLPVYLFTKAVTGDTANVEILVPPGAEIHDYQATPNNVKAIATAKVLVKNGLGLEKFLTTVIKNAQNPQLLEIDSSKGITAINKISQQETEISPGNPHIWLDPVLAQQQIINIRDGLITADPENKVTYQANAKAYIQKLDKLNHIYNQAFPRNNKCTFITFHDAFPYIAKRYNLQQVAVVKIPEDQLSPTDVQKAVNAVKKYRVKALFSEPGIDNKLLKSLSQDLHLTLHPLNSLEAGETDPQYYFKAMRDNLTTLANACK